MADRPSATSGGQSVAGLEFITALGADPLAFVRLAAELGCPHVGIGLAPIVRFPGHADWSMRDDAHLRAAVAAEARALGIAIGLGEGFIAMPGRAVRDMADDLDAMAELGAVRVNVLSGDPDRGRAHDECGAFAEAAAARGMAAVIEFLPGMPVIADLSSAAAAVRHAGRSDFGILVDTMHLFRSGGTVEDVAALDPATIGYIQLCDVPIVPRIPSYADEARYDRSAPGLGELPLAALMRVLPAGVALGLEVPRMAEAEAGRDLRSILADIVAAGRRLLVGVTSDHEQPVRSLPGT